MLGSLISSTVAARELGVHYSALSRWTSEGRVIPAGRTAGGHLRWNLDDLRKQLRVFGEYRLDTSIAPERSP